MMGAARRRGQPRREPIPVEAGEGAAALALEREVKISEGNVRREIVQHHRQQLEGALAALEAAICEDQGAPLYAIAQLDPVAAVELRGTYQAIADLVQAQLRAARNDWATERKPLATKKRSAS